MPLIGGTTYQPGAMPGASPLQPGAEPQEAVRILNLRLPRRPQGSPIPGQLMNAQGGGGGAMDELLRALMQAFSARGGGGGAPGGREVVGPGTPGTSAEDFGGARAIPAPRVRIGDTPGSERAPVAEPEPMPAPNQPLFPQGQFGGASIPGTTMPNKDWTWQAGLPLF